MDVLYKTEVVCVAESDVRDRAAAWFVYAIRVLRHDPTSAVHRSWSEAEQRARRNLMRLIQFLEAIIVLQLATEIWLTQNPRSVAEELGVLFTSYCIGIVGYCAVMFVAGRTATSKKPTNESNNGTEQQQHDRVRALAVPAAAVSPAPTRIEIKALSSNASTTAAMPITHQEAQEKAVCIEADR